MVQIHSVAEADGRSNLSKWATATLCMLHPAEMVKIYSSADAAELKLIEKQM